MKLASEAAATRVTYLIVAFLKWAEGIDLLDYATDFSPFRSEPGQQKHPQPIS